jgi:raffinose/stachyose/melibiose transport system substrate-binding protein
MRGTYKSALALAAAVLFGAAPALAQQPITWWYQRGANPDQQRALDQTLVQPWDAAHPKTPLHLEFRGATADKQIRIAMLSGHGPDIVMTPGPSYTVAMAAANQLLMLDDYAKKYDWNSRIVPVLRNIGMVNGHLYSLPRSYESMFLFYNKTLFEQNHWQPPETLDALAKLAHEMMVKGITPFGAGNADWHGANEWYITLVLNHDAGPDNVHKALTGQMHWDDPVFVHSIQLLKDWYQAGWFGSNYFSLTLEQGFARIASGLAGMAPDGNWAFGWVAPHFAESKMTPGIAGFPVRAGIPYPTYAIGVGSTLSINKSTPDPDADAELLNHVYSGQFYQAINKTWGAGDWNLPLSNFNRDELAKDTSQLFADAMASLSDATKAGHYGYTTWVFWPPATEEYMISGIEQVWLNQITPEQYMKKVDSIFQTELKQHKVPPIPPRS